MKLHIHLSGIGPMLTHNARLSNPMDEYARAMKLISGKRKKTDDDLVELARLEFMGGLYLTDDGKAGVPAWNVFKTIQEGGRLRRLGRHIERAMVFEAGDVLPIDHAGPATPEAMWNAGCYNQSSVKVGTSRVIRTRPMFSSWSMTLPNVILDTDVINQSDFEQSVSDAGFMVGLGDYRPRFGRFETELETV